MTNKEINKSELNEAFDWQQSQLEKLEKQKEVENKYFAEQKLINAHRAYKKSESSKLWRIYYGCCTLPIIAFIVAFNVFLIVTIYVYVKSLF